MSDFDLNNYFARRLGTPSQEKTKALAEASQQKRDELTRFRANVATQGAIVEANEKSWTGQLGLDTDSLAGAAVNTAASVYSGASRVIGDIATTGIDAYTYANDNSLSEDDFAAHTRMTQGKATAEDMARLNTPVGGNTNAKVKNATPLELIDNANKARALSTKVDSFFDQSSTINQAKRNQFNEDLTKDFGTSWDQVVAGNTKAKDGTTNGFVSGVSDMATGIAKLVYNAGEAALTNKQAASEYIAENIPQLAIGGLKKVGGKLLLASNVGYASDYYRQGIQKYQSENNGAYPPAQERQRMATWAASAALAEEVVDVGMLKNIGGIKAEAKAAVRSLKESMKVSGLAALEGAVGEGLTEGFQTVAEGEASLKPASAQDVYTGAVIGAVAGAGMTGGAAALNQATNGPTVERKVDIEEQKKSAVFKEAVQANDITAYADEPSKAVGVLFGHAQLDTTTPEVKQANLEQASTIVTDAQAKLDSLKAEYDTVSNDAQANAQAKLNQVKEILANTDLQDTGRVGQLTAIVTGLEEQIPTIQPEPKRARVLETQISKLEREVTNSSKLVDELTLSINPQTEEATKNASPEAIINLSMLSTDNLSVEAANVMANDKNNDLSDTQRFYLRAFSDARVAENKLKTQGKVSQEVLYGSDKNVGIAQYRARMAAALASKNQTVASRAIDGLTKFADDHAQKAQAVREAFSQGMGNQAVRLKAGGWVVLPKGQKFDSATMDKNGGLTVNSESLVQGIENESDALNKAVAELKAAAQNKFGETKIAAVQSKSSAAKQPPSKNISTPENVERETRVTETVPLSTRQSTPSNQSVDEDNSSSTALPTSKVKENVEQKKATTEQQERTSEASTSQVAEVLPTDANTGSLEVMLKATPKEEQRSYTERNLVADYFTQNAGNDNGTKRPLVVVKDFLANIGDKVEEFLQAEVNEAQEGMLNTFIATAKAWKNTIKSNLVRGNKGYEFEDMMQFFLTEDNDLEDNVKTAIAYGAYSWVVENATRPAYNTAEEINSILQRDESAIVSEHEQDVLGHVGVRQALIINALGQRIVAALGLKAKPNAPRNLQPQLEAAMGAHAMKLLLDEGILERTIIPGSVMAALTKDKDTAANAQFQFLKIVRDEQNTLNVAANAIMESSKGAQGVLDKLFSVEAGLKEPGFEAIPYTQKTTRNTSQAVPSTLAKIMTKENASENYIRQDTFNLMDQLTPEIALKIAGFVEVEPSQVHKAKRDSLNAKNDGLVREYERALSYIKDTLMPSDKGMEQPIFFDHTVWKQQRVGIATNMMNPQTSKIHRFMMYKPSWETEVKLDDTVMMDNFRLRVAEGLGVKTDKQSNVKSLDEYKEVISKPEIKAAISVLRKSIIKGESLTENDQNVLAAGVEAGGENMHSLDALIALAYYADAAAKNKPSFTVQMMSEVDGVTNGPMLSHLLMGAANSVKELYSLLNRGGFFQQGNPETQYNLWRSAAGHFDLYETTALHMTQAVQAAGIEQITMNALYAFTGELADKDTGVVKKAGRNIIKTPLTAMVFGSSVNSAVDSMADNFIDSIYTAIEEKKIDRLAIIDHLKTLGVNLRSDTNLMEYVFTQGEVTRLKGIFTDTLGEAVKSTMETDFEAFITQRKQFNTTAQMTFNIYNAVYTGMREQMVADLVKSGDIAVNPKTGVPLHDLTAAQEKELRTKLEAMAPVMHTAMSQDSNEVKAGLYISKSGRKLSTNNTYKVTSKFAKPIINSDGSSSKSTSAHGFEVVETAPGVAMAPMAVHSTDSAISHAAANLLEVLNVHDAHGAGLGMIQDAARNLNKATWDTTLKYSPAREITAALLRTLTGLEAVMKDNVLPANVMENLANVLVQYGLEQEINPKAAIQMLAISAQEMAYKADSMKLEAMAQMTAVDQYAMENGAYLVTAEDRSSASSLRSLLEVGLSADAQSALISIANKLDKVIDQVVAGEKVTVEVDQELDMTPVVEPRQTSKLGEVGTSIIESNVALVAMFEATPVMKVAEVIQQLREFVKPGFESTLLSMITKTSNADLEVRYVTPETAPDSVLASPLTNDSRGWYVSKGSKEAIYVLSPEFKHSGLTVETLLHELTHSSIARTIQQAQVDGKGDAYELVKDLDNLRQRAIEYTKSAKITSFNAALSDVQELVAWGMTNKEFQDKVLNKISIVSKTKGNPLVNGVRHLISLLTQFVFGTNNKAENVGMSVLISNVSGLFNAAKATNAQSDMLLNQQNNSAKTYSTVDIYEALRDSNNGNTVSDFFDNHLRNILTGIVTKLHGPFGSFKAALMENTNISEVGVYAEALNTGKAPFASKSLASGLSFTSQEVFVMEQVEATVKAGIEANEGQTSVAYRELMKLYREVSAKVKPENFHKGDWSLATPSEKAQATKLHDFIFEINQGPDNRSDYLSRFAALGMAHEEFNTILKDIDTKIKDRSTTGLSFNDRLAKYIESIIDWFAGKMTKTYDGQVADAKLTSLVEQLVGIEAKKRRNLIRKESFIAPIETALAGVTKTTRKKVDDFTKLPFFKNNSNALVRASAGIVSTVAGDRVDHVLEQINKFRDAHFKGQQGVFASLINEARGANASNLVSHFLLRMSKRVEAVRQDIIVQTGTVVVESFANKGTNLTQDQKKAISAVFLRNDLASLIDTYSLKDIQAMLIDSRKTDTAITAIEAKITGTKFKQFYINSAKGLGYKLATGEVRVAHLLMNAHNIVRMGGTQFMQQVSESEAVKYEQMVDQLASLYALKYSGSGDVKLAQEVMAAEFARTDGGHGIEMILKSHKELQRKSKELLFKDSDALVYKGYTPEIYNPFLEVLSATVTEGLDLIKMGYTKGEELPKDDADPSNEAKHIYTLRDAGLKPHLTGIFSYTGMRAKGSKVHNGNVSPLNSAGQLNVQNMQAIEQAKQINIRKMATDKNYDPSSVKDTFMAPVLNDKGNVVNYRYMMSEANKDSLLERDNRPEKLLGMLAGSIYDKVSSVEQNRKAVQALHYQFKEEFAERPQSYIKVGPSSPDPELREVYRLLPESTKRAIKEIWGTEGMQVRVDLLDINFGYRKVSAADAFNKEAQERNMVEKLLVMTAEYIFQGKAALKVRQGEDIWQAVVKATKSNLVVKSWSTLTGNFRSNVSQLLLLGVSPADMLKHHRVAFKGALSYKKDHAELFKLQNEIDTGYAKGNLDEIKRRIIILEDSIARNPVKPLIDAGLMPTIAEDIDPDDDLYSYKSRFNRKVESVTKSLNPHVVTVAKNILMTEDTTIYKTMSYATQISDFLARYTLYQHELNKKNPKTELEAIQFASDAFINYDIPTHRLMQYANDSGFVMFTKYYLRIQKMIAGLYRERPGSVMALLAAEHYLGAQPTVLDSSMFTRFGNPLDIGAFNYPESISQLTTIKLLSSTFTN